MNGEFAQMVALVAHGNACLANVGSARENKSDFEAVNSTFQYVRSVRFDVSNRSLDSRHVASVAEWLASISESGVDRLSLITRGSKPYAVAFANSHLWAIVCRVANGVDAWNASWVVNNEGVDPADRKPRIWEVEYRRMHDERPFALEPVDLEGRLRELRASVEAATEFAETDEALSQFSPALREALGIVVQDSPTPHWHPDLLPTVGYSLTARRLLAMAVRSWVFGGMGSWNDVGFADAERRARYQTVSQRLYDAVVGAIRDAANSFDGTRGAAAAS